MGDEDFIHKVLKRVLGRDYLLTDSPLTAASLRHVRVLDKEHLYHISVAEVSFALVPVKEEMMVSPAVLQQELRRISAVQSLPLAVYWEHATAAQTEEMRRLGLPYITGAKGCFLPFLWLHIPPTEWLTNPMSRYNDETSPLSPCAQVIVLRQLLHGDVAGKTIQQLAQHLPYSPALLGKSKEELVAVGLCSYPAGTRSGRFIFPENRHDLWLKSEPYLQSPVRRSFVTRPTDNVPFPVAGISALAMVSDLADDPMPTYAYYQRAVAGRLQPATIDEEGIRIQQWSYPPSALMSDGARRVDDISLYLSLRNNHDPRVRLALKSLHLP